MEVKQVNFIFCTSRMIALMDEIAKHFPFFLIYDTINSNQSLEIIMHFKPPTNINSIETLGR